VSQGSHHQLTLLLDSVTCHVQEARLSPADLAVEDVVGESRTRDIRSVVPPHPPPAPSPPILCLHYIEDISVRDG